MRLAAVALLGALVVGFVTAFGERLGGQAADELILWAPRLAEALIRAGARLCIPPSHRQRYTDEWLAHLDDLRAERDTPLATIGCAIAIILRGATRTVPPRTPGSDEPAPGHAARTHRPAPRGASTTPTVGDWVVGGVGVGVLAILASADAGNVVYGVSGALSGIGGIISIGGALIRWLKARHARQGGGGSSPP